MSCIVGIDRLRGSLSTVKTAAIVPSTIPLSQVPPLSFLSATYLQHVKQRGLSGIVETQEEQLGVLVEQAQGGQHIVD